MSKTISFPGDCADFNLQRIIGPDLRGAHYLPESATYDAATDTTTVTLRLMSQAELLAFVDDRRAETFERLEQWQGIVELFGTVPR
jgi:hypothetical protein